MAAGYPITKKIYLTKGNVINNILYQTSLPLLMGVNGLSSFAWASVSVDDSLKTS